MDLLQQLEASMDPRAGFVHALMPNMWTACGMSAIEASDLGQAVGRRIYVLGSHGTLDPESDVDVPADCPDCHTAAQPHGGIRAWGIAMQRNQAATR